MRRGLVWSLVFFIGAAVVALAVTVITGNKPLLGLDLKGGVSVVLKPEGNPSNNTLQQAVRIIDRRVNSLGVTNSEVQRQGNDVVINLPGIKDSQNALKVLGETAVLYFRPVYCTIPPYAASSSSPPTTRPPPSKTPATTGAAFAPGGSPVASLTAAVRSVAPTATTTPVTTPATVPATTVVPSQGSSGSGNVPVTSPPSQADCSASNAASLPSTPPSGDTANATVILPYYDNSLRYILGPADMQGNAISSATVILPTTGGGYEVQVTFTNKGGTEFDNIAAQRYAVYQQNTQNPGYGALEAIELDGVVQSAPVIQASSFNGTAVISGNSAAPFSAKQANDLALVLNSGSLPIRFTPQSVQTVSATIGKDSLTAGVAAGVGGIVLVMIYMILYYRALGLVVLLGLAVGGALLYSIISLLSQTEGLTLTLAGVIGIIVSIGITVDSYVVYFERLKDEVRGGRTIRSSTERSFARAFRTVLTADLVSFLAALILYLLTVGDVRGFAFMLGLSTLLDVATAYFFIRPMVILVGRHRTFTEARWLGVARGLGAVAGGDG